MAPSPNKHSKHSVLQAQAFDNTVVCVEARRRNRQDAGQIVLRKVRIAQEKSLMYWSLPNGLSAEVINELDTPFINLFRVITF